jgi:DNA processing protein
MQECFSFYKNIDNKNLRYLIALTRSDGIGTKTLYNLLNYHKTLENVYDYIKNSDNKNIILKELSYSDYEYELNIKNNSKIVTIFDDAYPYLLKQIDSPPPFLSVKGSVDILNTKIIGMVGAREASFSGLNIAKLLTEKIPTKFTTISGLARGVDTVLHENSLNHGTIGVIAQGIGSVYPKENAYLYDKIVDNNGAVISEMNPNATPIAKHFPKRNRIIAGMCFALIVIEASLKSGSIITAEHALEYGRDILVVPGFPLDPRYKGSNALIKEGAYMINDINDAINYALEASTKYENIGNKSILQRKKQQQLSFYKKEELAPKCHLNNKEDEEGAKGKVYKLLSASPVDLEIIQQSINLPIENILSLLLELELEDKITKYCNGYVKI